MRMCSKQVCVYSMYTLLVRVRMTSRDGSSDLLKLNARKVFATNQQRKCLATIFLMIYKLKCLYKAHIASEIIE